MFVIKFVTRKEPETNFPPYSFGRILKYGLSYKAGIGKFYTIGQINDFGGANNEND